MTDSDDLHALPVAELSADGSVLIVTVPLAIHRRGGRKRIVTPDGEPDWAPRREVNSSLVKALARGFRWKRLIEDAHFGSIVELAAAESISQSYVRRLLRLTLLSPEIVKAILDGRTKTLRLEDMRAEFPVGWAMQYLLLASLAPSEESPSRVSKFRARQAGAA